MCCIGPSSAEAKFRSLAHGIYEAIWIKKLLEDLKLPFSSPMKVYCDNKLLVSLHIIQFIVIKLNILKVRSTLYQIKD